MAEIIHFKNKRNFYVEKTMKRLHDLVKDATPEVRECFQRAISKEKLSKYLIMPDLKVSVDLPEKLTEPQERLLKKGLKQVIREYNSKLTKQIYDMVAWTIENLHIGGIRQKEIYYEQVFDPLSQTIKYNLWVRLEISKSDYSKAKVDAAQKMLDKAIREKDTEAKEKAMELLEKLREEV